VIDNRQNGKRRQRGFLSSRQAFVLLALLFMTPGFVAWVMHNSSEKGWRPEGTTNRGTLIHPARPLALPDTLTVGEQPMSSYLQGLWTLVYLGDADCDAVCDENLYKMRQIRTAQNENMRRVQRLYLVRDEAIAAELQARLDTEYKDMDVQLITEEQLQQLDPYFRIDEGPLLEDERVFIIDPLGNLMMLYPPDADPSGMLKDLKKLLKYSKIG
jgi:cytochrome oxidase Cu insertion factor (SCO1/SenC/PrrC family)